MMFNVLARIVWWLLCLPIRLIRRVLLYTLVRPITAPFQCTCRVAMAVVGISISVGIGLTALVEIQAHGLIGLLRVAASTGLCAFSAVQYAVLAVSQLVLTLARSAISHPMLYLTSFFSYLSSLFRITKFAAWIGLKVAKVCAWLGFPEAVRRALWASLRIGFSAAVQLVKWRVFGFSSDGDGSSTSGGGGGGIIISSGTGMAFALFESAKDAIGSVDGTTDTFDRTVASGCAWFNAALDTVDVAIARRVFNNLGTILLVYAVGLLVRFSYCSISFCFRNRRAVAAAAAKKKKKKQKSNINFSAAAKKTMASSSVRLFIAFALLIVSVTTPSSFSTTAPRHHNNQGRHPLRDPICVTVAATSSFSSNSYYDYFDHRNASPWQPSSHFVVAYPCQEEAPLFSSS